MASNDQPEVTATDFLKLGLAYALLASFSGFKNELPAASSVQAAAPQNIAPRGWLEIAKSVWVKIGKDRVMAVAAGFTFYAILALFPTITALVSIYGLFADAGSINNQLQALSGLLPGEVIGIIRDQVTRVASQGKTTLGFAFAVSLLASIWSANAGVKAMFDALNVAYEEDESRGFFRLNAVSLLFTLAMVGFALTALAATVGVPIAFAYLNLHSNGLAILIGLARWPLLLFCVMLALAMLYRFGTARKTPAWKWISVGSAFASITWLAASIGFSYYAANFARYNETYGALGAAIGFMTWIWVSAIVIMIGAELNAETEAHAKGEPAAVPERK